MKHQLSSISIAEQNEAAVEIIAHLMRDRARIPIYNWALTHGKTYYMNERSFAGRRGGAKKCYLNAYELAAAAADRYRIEDNRKRFHLAPDCNPVYVEGWCSVGSMIIEHGWCLDQNEQVIDPTLREGRVRGYFGIPFQWDCVWRTASRTGYFGIINNWIEQDHLLTIPVETFLWAPSPVKENPDA